MTFFGRRLKLLWFVATVLVQKNEVKGLTNRIMINEPLA